MLHDAYEVPARKDFHRLLEHLQVAAVLGVFSDNDLFDACGHKKHDVVILKLMGKAVVARLTDQVVAVVYEDILYKTFLLSPSGELEL